MRLHLLAGLAVLRRDLHLLVAYRLRLVSQVISVLFTLMLMYYLSRLVVVEPFGSPDRYYAFAVCGIMILQVILASLNAMPVALREEIVAGTFEGLVASPFGAVATLAWMCLAPMLLGLAIALLTVMVAVLIFGMHLVWPTAVLAVPVLALAALAFLPFALLAAAAVLIFKQASALSAFFITGISLVAGLYFPVALLPAGIRWVSEVQPFTPAVDLLRHTLIDLPLDGSPLTDALRLALFSVVLLPLSIVALAGALGHARRRGTVGEY